MKKNPSAIERKHILRLRSMLRYKEDYGKTFPISDAKRNNVLHDACTLRWAIRELEQVYDTSEIDPNWTRKKKDATAHVETRNDKILG